MTRRRTLARRRGFSLVELLIALGISAALLTAMLAALRASFRAYQATTEQASTQVVGRVALYRILSLVRNGSGFGPVPTGQQIFEPIQYSDSLIVVDDEETEIELAYDDQKNALTMRTRPYVPPNPNGGPPTGGSGNWDVPQVLLSGVRPSEASQGGGNPIFTLEWEDGIRLLRVTVDFTVDNEEGNSLGIERVGGGIDEVAALRLVGSAAPRRLVW